jgi:hypothetical protein
MREDRESFSKPTSKMKDLERPIPSFQNPPSPKPPANQRIQGFWGTAPKEGKERDDGLESFALGGRFNRKALTVVFWEGLSPDEPEEEGGEEGGEIEGNSHIPA